MLSCRGVSPPACGAQQGELDYEEARICGCDRCDRGLSGCSGQEEKGGAGAGCVDEQQREQLEVRQGRLPDLPAELVDPDLSVGQERAIALIGAARLSAREPEGSAVALAEEAGSGWPFSQPSS